MVFTNYLLAAVLSVFVIIFAIIVCLIALPCCIVCSVVAAIQECFVFLFPCCCKKRCIKVCEVEDFNLDDIAIHI